MLGLNIAWWFFDYMRSCMYHGFVMFIIYQTYCFVDKKFIKPYFEKLEHEKEKRRLDAEIAKNKKQNWLISLFINCILYKMILIIDLDWRHLD